MPPSKITYIIATHSLVYGAPQAFCDYLVKQQTDSFFFISHSLNAESDSPSQCVHYREGEPHSLASRTIKTKEQLCKTAIEMFWILCWVMGAVQRRVSDERQKIFIGVNPINALCGLILRKLGYVDRVVFYTIDYVPKRHPHPLINAIYHRIDRLCFNQADAVWNVSARINEGRLSNGYSTISRNNVQVVPIGVWPNDAAVLADSRKQNQLVFIGHLLEKQGVQYIIDAMPLILRDVPDATLLIIGGGEFEAPLKQQVAKLGLESHVRFTGWVRDRSEAERLLNESELAFAPYDKALDTFTYYADPTKLKDYLMCGLPIILTDVPHNAREIEAQHCGIIVDLSPESIANAVKTLLQDRPRLLKMREHTKEYIHQYAWDAIFSAATRQLLEGKK